MKNKAYIIMGIIFLIFALICPFPSQYGISWAVWRVSAGAFGCALIALGAYRATKQTKQ